MTRLVPGAVPGVFTLTPRHLTDARGSFYEGVRTEALEEATGQPFTPRQVNYSVSRRGTLRGLHGVTIPPGQAKLVSCVRGALRDVVVDLRLGSPAFGRYEITELDAASGRSVYVPEGVAHGFLALTDDACVCYLLSSAHVPGTQLDIHPLDPDLAIDWAGGDFGDDRGDGGSGDGRWLLSPKDAAAPTVAEARAAGLLPRWTGPATVAATTPREGGGDGG
ncbi:dTDP-4-dehydrorhamnose 3,5-epimerase family protein [Streptomyces sp. NPDC014894]|uniref:dTDP-4-dehydrorhamnose 3,5-epimerase family protein n=1 Tax=Streptomyces sp. NPDC014894 TaxID=3364931 RepID=UPI00370233C0